MSKGFPWTLGHVGTSNGARLWGQGWFVYVHMLNLVMGLAEFLRDNQAIVAPIIEWGGALLLLAIVLSPFLIIRHSFFKPTRWWHIVGAYAGSFFVFVASFYLIGKIDQWLIQTYLNTVELYGAYEDATFKHILWLLLTYPLLTFYSTKLLYGSFTMKRFGLTVVIAVVFTVVLVAIFGYTMLYFLGQALMNF